LRFLLDENVDVRLGRYLHDAGHDVKAVAIDHPASLPDESVLAISVAENRILVTHDKGFGELIFSRRLTHIGVILLRLAGPNETTRRLDAVIQRYPQGFEGFLVVTANRIRVRR
jgi:predicted nuclease of predicted toxin-antitoxin system